MSETSRAGCGGVSPPPLWAFPITCRHFVGFFAHPAVEKSKKAFFLLLVGKFAYTSPPMTMRLATFLNKVKPINFVNYWPLAIQLFKSHCLNNISIYMWKGLLWWLTELKPATVEMQDRVSSQCTNQTPVT